MAAVASRSGARRRALALCGAALWAVASALTAAASAAATPAPATSEDTVTYPAPPPAAARAVTWTFDLEGADGGALAGRALHRGDTLTLRASGLPHAAWILVELHSEPLTMGSGSTDAFGRLALTVTVPDEVEDGAHTVVATLTAPDVAPSTATAPVTVVGDPYGWLSPTVPLPGDLDLSARHLLATAGLASAFLLLAAVPAELLQSTLTENYSRAFGWLAPVMRRRSRRLPRRLRRPWLTCGITVALATLILGFGQTGLRLQPEAVITFASLFLSLTALNLGLNAGRLLVARRYLRTPGRLMPMPGALVVVAVSVVISQVLHIEPALLFGAVVTVQYGRSLSTRHAGALALVGAGSIFVMGLASWLALGALVTAFPGSDSVLVTLAEETLAGLVLETLAALVVGLLPFTYLDGKAIHDWRRRVWAGAYLVAAAAFILIVVPTGESWQESRTPLLTWLMIVGGFGVIAITAWAVFRLVPEHQVAKAAEPQDRDTADLSS